MALFVENKSSQESVMLRDIARSHLAEPAQASIEDALRFSPFSSRKQMDVFPQIEKKTLTIPIPIVQPACVWGRRALECERIV